MLIGYVLTLLKAIFDGMGASVGNLVSDNNHSHTLEVFWELFSSRAWISGIACFTLYVSIGPFITVWIGEKYVLSDHTLLLLIIGMYITATRSVVESFKEAYQLFADIWAPIAEAFLNLGGSILFGYLWGLNGVLLGVNLSLIIIIIIWKPYYTFRYGMKSPVIPYFIQFSLHTILLIAAAIVAKFAMRIINDDENKLIMTGITIIIGLLIYSITTYTILYFCTKGMRMFTIRIRNILAHRI
jgi:hypothetical protein